ncbi:MAG: tetratricopeptide repeat protein [Methanobrevibacter sp.]|nr:tetratricopeptide repeat protein [Methanobrevibacter sp.]
MFKTLKLKKYLSKLKDAYESDDFKESIDYADIILDLDNNNLEALKYKYNALANIEDYENALICVDKIIDLEKSCRALLNKGTTLCSLNRMEEGFKILDSIIDNCEEYELAYINKCGFLYDLQEFEEMSLLSEKILKKNPNCSAAYDIKSLAHLERGQYDLALDYINKALELDPNNNISLKRKETILSKTNPKH